MLSVQCDTGMERKLDLLVKELTKYHIAIASIQETKINGLSLTSGSLAIERFYILVRLYLLMVMLLPGGRVLVFCWMVEQQPHGGLLGVYGELCLHLLCQLD